jgi:hypothetical protein
LSRFVHSLHCDSVGLLPICQPRSRNSGKRIISRRAEMTCSNRSAALRFTLPRNPVRHGRSRSQASEHPSCLKHVHQFVRPGFAFGRFLAKHLAPCAVNVFAQVVEVQAQGVQFGEVQPHLFANPHCSIHQAHAFVGLLESQSVRFAAKQPSCYDVIAMRESTCGASRPRCRRTRP